MAPGLLTAIASTGSDFLHVIYFFSQLNFELSKSLIVSMCAHSHCRVPAVVFSLLNVFFFLNFELTISLFVSM
jgi:hypothetical protein